MAIRIGNRRRARFRRATSGNQDLTLLIYNLVKEQNAARKSALMAAFDANMASRSYDADYGGQPVDRAAVEAWYAQAIAAFPAGTTERDRLQAELISFRNEAIEKELAAYSDAYKNGTYAFGRQIDLNEYLRFLREAKGLAQDDATRMKYTVEQFIVEFNDVHDDMNAKGASAGSLLAFYRRQLKKAEDMGLTKDQGAYRDIQKYIRSAADQAAADAKRATQEKAQKIVIKRMGIAATAISGAVQAAFSMGILDATTRDQILGTGGMSTVNTFLKIPLQTRIAIVRAGADAGVQLSGEALTGQGLFDYVMETRDELKTLASADWLDLQTRTSLNTQVLRGTDMLTDGERAADSGLDAVLASSQGLGNPLVNVEAFKDHAATLKKTSTGDVASRAAIALLEGMVPDPRLFGGKTELSQLTPEEAETLATTFSGDLFINGNPQDIAREIINSHRDVYKLQNGGFLVFTTNENGTPEIRVDDNQIQGAKTYVLSTKLSSGRRVSSLVQQPSRSIKNAQGMTVAEVVTEVDEFGNADFKVVTPDGYKIDFDKYELWLSGQGIDPVFDQNSGDFVVYTTKGVFDGEAMRADARYSEYVPTEKWDGLVLGSNSQEAIQDITNDIVGLSYEAPGTQATFSFDASGNVTINDPVLAASRGFTQAGINALLNKIPEKKNELMQQIAVQNFRALESYENRTTMGQVTPQAELDALRQRGFVAAAESERFSRNPVTNNPFSVGLGGAAFAGVPQKTARTAELDRQREQARINAPKFVQTQKPDQGQPSDYFFRYTQLSQAPAPAPTSSFSPTGLGKAPSFAPTTFKPTFTPQQVNQSLIDFRAGERASLNISSTTDTARR
jgi:hypothetical protein